MECKAERDNGLFLSLHHHDVVLARAVECPSGIVSVISVLFPIAPLSAVSNHHDANVA